MSFTIQYTNMRFEICIPEIYRQPYFRLTYPHRISTDYLFYKCMNINMCVHIYIYIYICEQPRGKGTPVYWDSVF